jgi:DNA-binding MarR family transcriptional regulator
VTDQNSVESGFLENYLPYLMARASFLVSDQFHRQLEKSGVSVPFWRVLAALLDHPLLSVGELAKITLYKQPTLTKILDRMIELGLVRRMNCEKDRRRVDVSITDAGRHLVKGLVDQALMHEKQVLSAFSDADAATLRHVLRDLIECLDPA